MISNNVLFVIFSFTLLKILQFLFKFLGLFQCLFVFYLSLSILLLLLLDNGLSLLNRFYSTVNLTAMLVISLFYWWLFEWNMTVRLADCTNSLKIANLFIWLSSFLFSPEGLSFFFDINLKKHLFVHKFFLPFLLFVSNFFKQLYSGLNLFDFNF